MPGLLNLLNQDFWRNPWVLLIILFTIWMIVDAIRRQDLNLLQADVFVVGVLVVVLNLLIDMTYGWFDPRIRYT